jgi:Icc-related predicted phosphoesterase
MGASGRYAFSQLNQDHRSWLGAPPVSADTDHGILACHGTPADDNQYLVEEPLEGRLVRAHPAAIQKRLGDVRARAVLCGHSHQQHLIQLPKGPLILNPGSVGCRSYYDLDDDPYVPEAGSSHA